MLNNLSDHYRISCIFDVSRQAIGHCGEKVAGGTLPKTTANAEELIASPDVDVVVVCNVNAFHVSQAILALQHNKYVFVEKPLALNYRDLDAIIAAEKTSEARVFVGYQRRYAEAFLDALKEVGKMEKVEYIRVRGMWHVAVNPLTRTCLTWRNRHHRAEPRLCKPVWHIPKKMDRLS